MRNVSERIAMLCAVLDCAEDAALSLNSHARWSVARRQELLLHQGDKSSQCHIVMSGSADLRALGSDGQYVQITTVEPGEVFGSYPEPETARADAKATAAIEMVSFDAQVLYRLTQTYAEIGAGLARIFARQLSNVLDRFAARVTLTASGRVYAQLLAMADEAGVISPLPVVAALAVQAQTTRETASRAISQLERRGIMRREADLWVIVSPRMLEELAV